MMVRNLIQINDVNNTAVSPHGVSSGRSANGDTQVVIKRNPRRKKKRLKIGTWNVRTLYQVGKLDNLIIEMKRMKVDILGISEVRWTGSGILKKDGCQLIYSGKKDVHENGVGILLSPEAARGLRGYEAIDDRIILAKVAAQPFNINILQVYMPTSDHTDEEIDEVYERLESLMNKTKNNEVNIVMGDWNAKVGKECDGEMVGSFGLGKRNEKGERLIEFAKKKKLCIANTWFKQHKRRLFTWKSPDGTTKNQIDYIMVPTRFRNSVISTKTYPGADCCTDHNPVTMKFQLKTQKIEKTKKESVFGFKRFE